MTPLHDHRLVRLYALHPWRVWLALLAACALTACSTPLAPRAVQPNKVTAEIPPGIVSVTYTDPARFGVARDNPRDNPRENPRARQAWLDALCVYLSEQAAAALAPGQRLEVELTDARRADASRPPQLDLRFKLLAADGRVLRQGSRQLRDTEFLARAPRHHGDPQRHEKTLVDDWVAQEFKPG